MVDRGYNAGAQLGVLITVKADTPTRSTSRETYSVVGELTQLIIQHPLLSVSPLRFRSTPCALIWSSSSEVEAQYPVETQEW